MRKLSKLALLTAVLVLAMSVSALAVKYQSAEWEFGDEKNQWGLVYLLEYGEDGEFPDEGILMPFFKITFEGDKEWAKEKIAGLYNISWTGPYIKDGKELKTTFGVRLPVKFSPYIAEFNNNKHVGLYVEGLDYEFGPANLALKFAWMFPNPLAGNATTKYGTTDPYDGPWANDLLVDLALKVDVLQLDVALNRYAEDKEDPSEGLYDYYHNVAVEAQLKDAIPGLTLNGVYAFYQQDKDWLYEVKADYKVSDALKVWAGHRNSKFWDDYENEIEGTWKKTSVMGGASTDKNVAYVGEGKTIEALYKRDNSIDFGAEYSFAFDPVTGKLTASYDTTNPKARGDFDDVIAVGLNTKAYDFTLNQAVNVYLADEDTTEAARQATPYNDLDKPRIDYALDFYTPKYNLPVDFASAFIQGKVNFDYDTNFVEDSRYHLIGAVEVGVTADVWRLPGLYLGGIFAYDMPSDKEQIEDPFKYALILKYDAPNKVKFRLEYLSSADYKNTTKFVRNEAINDRYGDIRYYGNSKFHGIRLSVGFPL